VVLESYLEGAMPPVPILPADQKRERPSAALRRDELSVLAFISERVERGDK
jgi:hypothetical protein